MWCVYLLSCRTHHTIEVLLLTLFQDFFKLISGLLFYFYYYDHLFLWLSFLASHPIFAGIRMFIFASCSLVQRQLLPVQQPHGHTLCGLRLFLHWRLSFTICVSQSSPGSFTNRFRSHKEEGRKEFSRSLERQCAFCLNHVASSLAHPRQITIHF